MLDVGEASPKRLDKAWMETVENDVAQLQSDLTGCLARVTVLETQVAGLQCTGGTTYEENGFKYHAFKQVNSHNTAQPTKLTLCCLARRAARPPPL